MFSDAAAIPQLARDQAIQGAGSSHSCSEFLRSLGVLAAIFGFHWLIDG
jgi:hypothetical protein